MMFQTKLIVIYKKHYHNACTELRKADSDVQVKHLAMKTNEWPV